MTASAVAAAPSRAKNKSVRFCSFCLTGHHQYCPSASNHGDRGVWRCECDCEVARAGKCVLCSRRPPVCGGLDPKTSTCVDTNDCATALSLSRQKARRELLGSYADEPQAILAGTPRQASNGVGTRPVALVRECLCGCEGLTKGGLFLPGHDARLLAAVVKQAQAGDSEARARFAALGVSEALLAKFDKRVS